MKTNNFSTFSFILLALFFTCRNEKRQLIVSGEQLSKPSQSEQLNQTSKVYDTLKKLSNPFVENWYKVQDSVAENFFLNNSIYKSYLDTLNGLENAITEQNRNITISESEEYFYICFDPKTESDKIFYRKTYNSIPKEVFDSKSHNVSTIDYINISYDSKILALGFDSGNGFTSNILFFDLKTSKLLKDKISNINTDYGDIQWLPDSSGFIYLYFPIVDKANKDFKKKSFSTLHILGQENQLTPVFGNSREVKIKADFYPKVNISSSKDKYIIGYEASSNDFYRSYIAKIDDVINNKPNWKPFFNLKDSIYYNQGIIKNDVYYFRQSFKGSTRLCSTEITKPDFRNPKIIYQGNAEEQIDKFEITKNDIYYSTLKYGSEVTLTKIDKNSKAKTIELPFTPGFLKFFGASTANNFIGIGIDGWVSNYVRLLIDSNEVMFSENVMKSITSSDYKNFEIKQFMVKSHDMAEVPLTLVVNQNFSLDSTNEILLYVYGAYGENITPYFEPMLLEWVLRGGVLAFAHVRGGGEKGKNWHLQGMKNLKSNSWKDLIACTEYLIDQNITNKGLISLNTSSAGGITAAMAINEKPELFSSFIADVPRLNPYDLELDGSLSSTSYLEYGSLKDSTEKKGLIAMDPFLNINGKKNYPATLLMPSYLDDRIPLWDNGKYIAKLRDSTNINRPMLLDIDYESGHATYGSTYSVYYSRLLSFAKLNMNR
jgi:prolyl oligopeptidase